MTVINFDQSQDSRRDKIGRTRSRRWKIPSLQFTDAMSYSADSWHSLGLRLIVFLTLLFIRIRKVEEAKLFLQRLVSVDKSFSIKRFEESTRIGNQSLKSKMYNCNTSRCKSGQNSGFGASNKRWNNISKNRYTLTQKRLVIKESNSLFYFHFC